MDRFQGLLGIAVILGLVVLLSKHRRHIKWRTLGVGLALQVAFAFLVLKWSWGFEALKAVSEGVTRVIHFTDEGTKFVFGSLFDTEKVGFVFAIQVLPVIIFLGALIGALYYLRVVQFVVDIIGSVLQKLLGVSKLEGVWASTVIFLGQSEAPLLVAPYLRTMTTSQLFTCMTGGFAAVAGSTLVGYALLGAPLPYLLAAAVMNAPGCLLIGKALWPETEEVTNDANVRDVRDTESKNFIDALGRGAMAGGHIAVIVGCLLIAFVALIAMASAFLGMIGGWVGQPNWSLEGLFGLLFGPVAWLIGTPWAEASQIGNYIGQKTVLNEFVAYSNFGPVVPELSPKAVLVGTFALAGFANFASIAIQIGSIGALAPERRGDVAKLGMFALLGGTLTNLLNAAIVGVIAS